jgi:hypothetical protein
MVAQQAAKVALKNQRDSETNLRWGGHYLHRGRRVEPTAHAWFGLWLVALLDTPLMCHTKPMAKGNIKLASSRAIGAGFDTIRPMYSWCT